MHRTVALVAAFLTAACGASTGTPAPANEGTAGSGGSGGSSISGLAGAAGAMPTQPGGGAGMANGGGAGGTTQVVDGGVDSTANPMSDASAPDAPAFDAGTRQVLMVGLSTGKPTPGDTIMINRLEGRGFKVTLVSDTAVTAAAAAGKDLILISSSEESFNLLTKLRDLAIPTLCMEDGSFADMKMASARGHAMGTSALKFVGTDPLAGGLSGSVTIATNPPDPADMGWGTVGAKAVVAATTLADPVQAALFGYQKGDDMVGMTAPARRVGFAAREAIAAHFSPEGLKVFDTAVDWTLGLK